MGVGQCQKCLTKVESEGFARPELETKEKPLLTKDRMGCRRAKSCGDISFTVGHAGD